MKFTIRQMLFAMIGIALFAAVIGAGANGSPLAYGMAVSLGMLSFYFLTFAAIYWSACLLIRIFRKAVPQKHTQQPIESEATS